MDEDYQFHLRGNDLREGGRQSEIYSIKYTLRSCLHHSHLRVFLRYCKMIRQAHLLIEHLLVTPQFAHCLQVAKTLDGKLMSPQLKFTSSLLVTENQFRMCQHPAGNGSSEIQCQSRRDFQSYEDTEEYMDDFTESGKITFSWLSKGEN